MGKKFWHNDIIDAMGETQFVQRIVGFVNLNTEDTERAGGMAGQVRHAH